MIYIYIYLLTLGTRWRILHSELCPCALTVTYEYSNLITPWRKNKLNNVTERKKKRQSLL